MTGAQRIASERQRQIDEEGWTPEHDDQHRDRELAWAAISYAVPDGSEVCRVFKSSFRGLQLKDTWPELWSSVWDKRPLPGHSTTKRIRALERAGALIAAEIDRLLRVLAGATAPAGD